MSKLNQNFGDGFDFPVIRPEILSFVSKPFDATSAIIDVPTTIDKRFSLLGVKLLDLRLRFTVAIMEKQMKINTAFKWNFSKMLYIG